MKCPDCGRELEFVAEFTDEEKKELDAVILQLNMADELTKFTIDIDNIRTDEQIVEFVTAVYSKAIEAKIADLRLFKKLRDKYAPGEKAELKFLDGKMYKHPL